MDRTSVPRLPGVSGALIPELPKEAQVPSRIHFLIKRGKIELPVSARLEIIRQKQVLQSLLRLTLALYLEKLFRHEFSEAEEILLRYRGLEELLLYELFEKNNYPEEIDLKDETREWLLQFSDLLPESTRESL